jgi:hypothetical protein
MPNGTKIIIMADNNQDINKINEGFDSLRSSIKGLTKEFPEFADSMQAGLIAISKELPGVVESMGKFNKANKELVANGEKPKSMLSQLTGSMFSWNTAISVGLTLLITYGGEIIKWIGSLNKGKDAMAQAKQNFEALNNAVGSTDYKNAIKDVIQLKIAIDNNKKSTIDKTAVVKQYNDTLGKSMGHLETIEQVENRIKKGSSEYIKWTLQKAAANYALTNGVDKIISKEKDIQSSELRIKSLQNDLRKISEDAKNDSDDTMTQDKYANQYRRTNEELVRERNILKTKQGLREKEIQDVTNFSDRFQSIANNIAKKNKFSTNVNDFQKDSIDWISNQIMELKKKTDSGIIGSKTFKEIQQFQDKLNKLNNPKKEEKTDKIEPKKPNGPDPDVEARIESLSKMAELNLQGYALEIEQTRQHFKKQIELHKGNKATVEQLKKEEFATINAINKKFEDEEAKALRDYHKELLHSAQEYKINAQEIAITNLEEETKEKIDKLNIQEKAISKKAVELQNHSFDLINEGKLAEADLAQKAAEDEKKLLETTGKLRLAIIADQKKKEEAIKAGKDPNAPETPQNNPEAATENKPEQDPATQKLQQQLLNWQTEKEAAVRAAKEKGQSVFDVEATFVAKKINLEAQLVSAKVHKADDFINSVLKNTKKESAIYKAAFIAKKATSISDVIVTTSEAVMKSFGAYSSIPFIGQALGIAQAAFMAAQGATSIANIVKQKPGMATGGMFVSDGRGALLSGYSRTDNTNAYLRSGEAVVVSEAMRNPWARNLVSAINVAHGGRDFSMPNPGRGYAIGGIFTDGGNANRYYSQPVNDQKDMANTLAHQLINNFPPIYVDVKDVNNQQSILAQTVDRVNL